MRQEELSRFKELLSVPSKTYLEKMMVAHIESVLSEIDGVSFWKDDFDNVYAVKGELNDGEYYPMFVAHTDTVHQIVDKINVIEGEKVLPPTFGKSFPQDEVHQVLYALDNNDLPTGIGGDDKAGIFICLELLRTLDKVKVGLFVSEETGCHGSSKCDLDFLTDVGYIVQYDAPGNHLITETCSGVRLFEKNGEFINKVLPVIEKTMETEMMLQAHPYTDVSQLKMKTDVSCINISCGYYNMHTPSEFVSIQDVEKAIETGDYIVRELGLKKYEYKYEKPNYGGFFYNDYEDDSDDNNDYFIDSQISIKEESDGIMIESNYTYDQLFLSDDDCVELYDYLKTYLKRKLAY